MASLENISAMIAQRQYGDAAAALKKLVRKKSKARIDWQAAISVAGQLGDQDLALAAAQNWRAESPADPHRIMAEITALGNVAKHKDAAHLSRELQKNSRAAADGYYFEGFYQARFGKRDLALGLQRKALDINPDHAFAWEQIALLNGYDNRDAEIAKMVDCEKRLRAPDQLIALYYALGRAFDSADDFDNAFAYISKGARLRQGPAPFDMAGVRAYLNRLKLTFTENFIANHENEDIGGEAIFIFSPPRSGSTLIEQILTTAPGITATSEHTILRAAAIALGSMEPPEMAAVANYERKDWRKISMGYFDRLRKRFGPGKAYTDKTLINYYYGGLIRSVFPEAKIVWLKRDPRDVVWSCFRSRINANQWAENLSTTCEFIKAHHEITDYWAELFGNRLIEISYEDLAAKPEETTAALFAHCGRDRPDDWAAFYESDNPVATASLAQVRAPLNTKAVGSWRRYEKFLAPIYDQHFN
ncbi:MAG: hypothetical protein HKN14_14490 [Marinicaulis sp.]|nr:hypothetical protein [Marinicaulis sp.]